MNARSKNSRTPLFWAISYDGFNMAKLLLANDTDVHAKDRDNEMPLDWADNPEMKALLRRRGTE